MTEVVVRQSGGADIVSIPKAISRVLGIAKGTVLELALEGDRIVLTPRHEKALPTLEELLAGNDPTMFALTAEDEQWLGDPPKGNEL